MQSTPKLQEIDSGATYPIAPEVVFDTRVNQDSPDPVHEVLSLLSRRRAQTAADPSQSEPSQRMEVTPTVDVTFRAAAVDGVAAAAKRSAIGRRVKNASVAFLFALCSAIAAAVWTHHGDVARQMASRWMPPFVLASFAPAEEDQAPTQQAVAVQPEGAAPAVAASPADSQLLTSMARDLAAMGQQIEQLKASIAELRDGQAQLSRDIAKSLETISSEKVTALPPRPAAAPRKPRPVPPPPPAATASTVPPPYYPAYPAPPAPAPPPPQTMVQPDGEPVVRPPMPLH
ncbi:MAG: hypothetical protein E7813_19905 [Bradyrhizobium sp.]|uniref:hypothetical protein n=1 Tax=Bradyrhizobium sp. TaxID=376 RepID=UPI001227A66E|nr:hypothetical protein [Bradyrhizobium sp.]THD62444.1 MAG: hypothetical protein E7813_19905 [Bradyrhizobium sp.]